PAPPSELWLRLTITSCRRLRRALTRLGTMSSRRSHQNEVLMSCLNVFEQLKVFGPDGAHVVDTVIGLLVIVGMREVREHAGLIRDKGRKAFFAKLGLDACGHICCAKIPPDHGEGEES